MYRKIKRIGLAGPILSEGTVFICLYGQATTETSHKKGLINSATQNSDKFKTNKINLNNKQNHDKMVYIPCTN